ncbi:MAG: hypothetical protein EAZ99_06155 [Alphaproteobacteria bacterium]|nr:MAG: hypothetical protein EAZ99_06155 [Alphaproteobacteria bacterium]
MLKRSLIGPVFVLLAAILWGFSAFTKKWLLAYIDPLTLMVLNSIATALTLVFVWTRPVAALSSFKRFAWFFLGLAFFGTTIGTTLLYAAIDNLDLAVASIVGKIQPVFVIILAAMFLRERIFLSDCLLSLAAIIGAILVTIRSPADLLTISHVTVIGLSAAVGSSIGWSISGVIGRHLSSHEQSPTPSEITFFRYLLGAIIVTPLVDFPALQNVDQRWEYDWPFGAAVVVLAFLTTTLPAWFYYKGLKTVSAGYASVIELFSPLTAILLGVVFLGERLSIWQWTGGLIVLASITVMEVMRTRRKRVNLST